MPVAVIKHCNDHGILYDAIVFVCPGCIQLERGRGSGLHMLPVNSDKKKPSWDWDGDLEKPTLSPSIRTRNISGICHSYLEKGQIRYLSDCDHDLKNQTIDLPELPQWIIDEKGDI